MPQVTVIIPTHNRDALVAKAINSVLGQTFQDIEVIVVDDGSSDQTLQVVRVLQEWDTRIRLLKLSTSLGRSGGLQRNEAIKAAMGEYICYLDDDDVMTPRAVEARVQFLEENPSLDFCWGQTLFIRVPAAGHRMVDHQIVERLVPVPDKTIHWIEGTVIPNELMHRSGLLGDETGLWWSAGRGEDRRLMTEILDAGFTGEGLPVTTSIYGHTAPFNPKRAMLRDRGRSSSMSPAPAKLPPTRTGRIQALEESSTADKEKRNVRGRR